MALLPPRKEPAMSDLRTAAQALSDALQLDYEAVKDDPPRSPHRRRLTALHKAAPYFHEPLAAMRAALAAITEPPDHLRAGAPDEPTDDDPWLSAEDFEHYRKAPGALYGTAIPPLSEDMRRSAYEQCLAIVRSHEALRVEVERLRAAAPASEDDGAPR
jgi:hypothetical protein